MKTETFREIHREKEKPERERERERQKEREREIKSDYTHKNGTKYGK